MTNATKDRKKKAKSKNSSRNNNVNRAYSQSSNKNEQARKSHVKSQDKVKGLIKTICIVFVILLLLFVASETFQVGTLSSTSDSLKSFVSSLTPGDGYPYKISSSSVKDIDMMSSNVFLLTDTSTITLDKTAKEISKFNHTYANPAMSINNGKAVVYDRGGYRYMVQSRTDKINSGKTKNEILTCEIGKSGNIAVATIAKNSNNYVSVYKSKQSKEMFKWVCYSEKIVDIALSDNGKYMAVATVSAKDANMLSKVYIFDFKYSSAVATLEYKDTSMYQIDFIGTDDVVAIGDKTRSIIKNKSNKKEDTDFGTSTLTRYSMSEDGVSALVLSEFGSANLNLLKVYSKTGKELYTKKFNSNVGWVYCDGKNVNVLSENKIYVYDLKGNEKKKIDVKSDSMKVLSKGRTKYIYGVGEIRQRS